MFKIRQVCPLPFNACRLWASKGCQVSKVRAHDRNTVASTTLGIGCATGFLLACRSHIPFPDLTERSTRRGATSLEKAWQMPRRPRIGSRQDFRRCPCREVLCPEARRVQGPGPFTSGRSALRQRPAHGSSPAQAHPLGRRNPCRRPTRRPTSRQEGGALARHECSCAWQGSGRAVGPTLKAAPPTTVHHNLVVCRIPRLHATHSYQAITSAAVFRCRSGTRASSAGYPTGMSKNGRSLSGRFRIFCRKFMGLGVCVSATSPA